MIQLNHVTKTLADKDVLSDIHLELNEGECLLLRGHNGCGKTMLLRLLAGLIKPSKGEISYNNEYRFGVVIENPHFFLNESAYYNMKYLASINKRIDAKVIDTFLERLNLLEYKNKKVSKYSLGMKQRLALCQAFMEDPDVILLDEPFNALDDENLGVVHDMINEFKQKGKLIVIASHGEVLNKELFSRFIQMNNGKITSDSKEY